ncbi:MAG TPA: asparaginase [Spirillospora sp.]
MTERRTIAVFATGGTISAVADARRRHGGGLSGTDLTAFYRDLDDSVELRPIEVDRIPGRAMTPGNMLTLATRITEEVSRGCDGVVVLHGTDTLEETAYFLALTLSVPVPVVVTGAMRLPAQPGADGAANIRAAVVAACDDRLRDLGPVVAFADELHLARRVAKVHTTRVDAFASPGHGPVGLVSEGKAILYSTGRPGTDHLGMPPAAELERTRVPLLWVTAGDDGSLCEAAAATSSGLVVAGTGGGHTPPPFAGRLASVIKTGVPVVLASRCPAGPLLTDTYGGPGGEGELAAMGVVPVGDLPAVKARLRLQVALALGMAPRDAFPIW